MNMQFYETKMGHQFFQVQLPALLSALQQIAAALEQSPGTVRLSPEVPADYLSDLYYGNLEPDKEINNDVIRRCTKEIIDMQEEIKQQLSPEEFAQVEKLTMKIEQRACEETDAAFQTGFRTAMQMVVAGLSIPAEASKRPD